MMFLLVWAVLLVLFLTVAVYKGHKNKKRVKKLEIKVNRIWEKVK